MNLPKSVDDRSILQHEPISSYCTMLLRAVGSRRHRREVENAFVQAMGRLEGQTGAVVKRWIALVFGIDLAQEHTIHFRDNGLTFYPFFLEYCCRLTAGEKDHECMCQISKKDPEALNIRWSQDEAPHSTKSRSSKGTHRRRNDTHKLPCPAANAAARTGNAVTEIHPMGHTESGLKPAGSIGTRAPEVHSAELNTETPTRESTTNISEEKISQKKTRKRKSTHQKSTVVDVPGEAVLVDNSTAREEVAPVSTEKRRKVSSCTALGKRRTTLSAAHEKGRSTDNAPVPPTKAAHLCMDSNSRSSRSNVLVSRPILHPPRRSMSVGEHLRQTILYRDKLHAEERVMHSYTQLSQPVVSPTNDERIPEIETTISIPERPRRYSMTYHTVGEPVTMVDGDNMLVDQPDNAVNISTSAITQQHTYPANRAVHASQLSATALFSAASEIEPLQVSLGQKGSRQTELEATQSGRNTPLLKELHRGVDRNTQPIPFRPIVSTGTVPVQTHFNPSSRRSEYRRDVNPLQGDGVRNELLSPLAANPVHLSDWIDFREEDLGDEESAIFDTYDVDDALVYPAEELQEHALGVDRSKPRLPSPPPIWAQSRQEVCECLEQFRSYHSGVYSRKDVVKGYLLGAFSARRDIFDQGGKVIVSHGGGKAESLLDSIMGRRFQAAQDQAASDKSVRALLKNYKENRPLVLLADDKYALFPYNLMASGYTYVVLGVYWISHAWAEYQPAPDGLTRVVRWKFAFQWCDGQGDPWWIVTPQSAISHSPHLILQAANKSEILTNEKGPSSFRCTHCLQSSALVYAGNVCLNPKCTDFWFPEGKEPWDLSYREDFLRWLPKTFKGLIQMKPAIATHPPGRVMKSSPWTQGWHCAQCGRLSSRYRWECWECAHCQVSVPVNMKVFTAKDFLHLRPSSEFMHSRIGKNSGISACRPEPLDFGPGKGFSNRLTFVLPYGRGKIHLILGTPLSNGNANMLFERYQQQAFSGELTLRRYPLKTHRARGSLLTNYFSQNSGEPYQYVGGTENTVPFARAPNCVLGALDLIKERARLAVDSDIPFNEVLSAAYMERQKMSFHSDSEKGLGPVVASLSLGSPAYIHFRPLALEERAKQQCQYVLSLVLRHGDVLIMEGHRVQIHYEHTVIPLNFRIAATARHIGVVR